jgi:hypothetical protein
VGIAGAVYAGNRHDARLWRDYIQVRPGMTQAQAKAILGDPSWSGRCGAEFPYGYAKDCAAEFGYRSAYAPLNPLYWVVQIDARNRVIEADWIASP